MTDLEKKRAEFVVDAVVDTSVAVTSMVVAHDPVVAGMVALSGTAGKELIKKTLVPKLLSLFARLTGKASPSDQDMRDRIDQNPEAVMQAVRRLLDADAAVVPILSDLVLDYMEPTPKAVDGFFRDFAQFLADLSSDDIVALRRIFALGREGIRPHVSKMSVQWGRERAVEAQDPRVNWARTTPGSDGMDMEQAAEEIIANAQRVVELLRKHNVGQDPIRGGGPTTTLGVIGSSTVDWSTAVSMDVDVVQRIYFLLKRSERF